MSTTGMRSNVREGVAIVNLAACRYAGQAIIETPGRLAP